MQRLSIFFAAVVFLGMLCAPASASIQVTPQQEPDSARVETDADAAVRDGAPARMGAPAAEDLKLEPYTFRTDDGREVEAELGRFRVPENRSSGSGSTIELAFVRFPSTNPDPGPPIVYLAGGPGGSGSGTAEGSRFDLFMALRDVADVIAFDQRSTGLSHRLPACPHGWTFPLDRPATRDALLEAALAGARKCAAFWRDEGVDLSAYNTVESADDLEDLRSVLGAEMISLWSISYGTHLALATIKRHPQSIHRTILAGVEGPDHTYKQPSDQQAMLEKIEALVREDPELREELPSLTAAIDTVLRRLERQPAVVTVADPESGDSVTVAVGTFDLQRITATLLFGPQAFGGLPKMFVDMMNGDFSSAANLTRQWNRSGGFSAMPAAMDAASGMSDQRRTRYDAERNDALLGDAINFPFPELADALGVPDLGPAFRSPVIADVPALFISGTLDGRTPVGNTLDVRPGFTDSAHLIIEGAGHSDPLFLSSPHIEEVMIDFLKGKPVADEVIKLPPPEFERLESMDEVTEVTQDSGALERFSGTYGIPNADMEITVEATSSALRITFPGRGTFDFYPTSDTTFAMREAAVRTTFHIDASGKVSGMSGVAQGQAFEAVRME